MVKSHNILLLFLLHVSMISTKRYKKKTATCRQACNDCLSRAFTRLFNYLNVNYSMIETTLPEPTVRPPSRYQTAILLCANGDFSCDLWGKIRFFCCVRVVFGNFVIMVLSWHSSLFSQINYKIS